MARQAAGKTPLKQAAERKTDAGGITTPRMNAYDGIYSASFRLPPFSLDKLLQQKGWDVVEDMLTMSACRAPFNVKRYAALKDGWEILPAVNDPYDSRSELAKNYADYVRWCLQNIVSPAGLHLDFRSVIFEIMRAWWDGFRVSEIGYRYLEEGPYKGMLGFDGFFAKRAKQIGFEIDPRTGQPLHITSYTPGSVITGPGQVLVQGGYDFDIELERCILYTYNPDASLPQGAGDWRGCFKHWWALDNTQRFWMKALERWGAPVIIGQGPSDGLDAIVASLDNIRNGGSAALPDNVKAQIVQAAPGVFEGFRLASQWHEQQIAKNIQGNTLSTGEGENGATSAGSDVHQDMGEIVYDFGKRDIEGVMGAQVIQRLCEYSIPGFDPILTPQLSLGGSESGDRLETAQMFDYLIKDGVVSKSAKFIREQLDLPPLDPDEEKALQQEAQAQQEAQQQLADARNSGQAKAMNDHEAARALDILTRAICARMEQEGKKDDPNAA